ncbi:MAG: diguanylate cyclase [Sinobacteraceae bacterium]|nr:diguanylate cyclase [Nevskiaceae bacterium]
MEPLGRMAQLRFVRRVHKLRTLGLATGFLCVAAPLLSLHAPPWQWAALMVHGFLWPHLAYALAARSAQPQQTELRNLLIDSALGGIWIALMRFNLVPSALLATMLAMDKISVGGWRLLGRAALLQALACAVTAAANDFAFAPQSSTPVILACLPFLVTYPLAVSTAAHALARTVRRQNKLLKALSRFDPLSGLPNRSHWEEVAAGELRRHQRSGRPAALMMIDIDHFKPVNDRYGHVVGDEVIRALGVVLRNHLRDIDTPGRYGGDEFAAVLPECTLPQALATAERIRSRVEALRHPQAPELRSTVSIGVAAANGSMADVREWIAQADAALYQAKTLGRNRVSGPMPGGLFDA